MLVLLNSLLLGLLAFAWGILIHGHVAWFLTAEAFALVT